MQLGVDVHLVQQFGFEIVDVSRAPGGDQVIDEHLHAATFHDRLQKPETLRLIGQAVEEAKLLCRRFRVRR